MAELILGAAALGILALTCHQLILLLPKRSYLLPLLIVLLALAAILSGPLIFQGGPLLIFGYIAVLPVAFLALPPSLYLYTQALIAKQKWHWQWRHVRLYWTQLFGVPLALLILTMPEAEQQALFLSDSAEFELQGHSLLTAVAFLLVTLLWLVMSLYYLIRITVTLRRYRQQLKQVFAADAGKRLVWLNGLMLTLLVSWNYAVLVFMAEDHFAWPWLNQTGVLLLALILVWFLCTGGLNQRPGFAEVFADARALNLIEPAPALPPAQDADKYQRSALGEAQAQRIVEKVQHAVYQDELYLDSGLTLFKLAEQIGVPAQYLSQTLNQRLKLSFYDYINAARVKAAQQQLRQTNDSALTIAMNVGFNARSSFYKAFKASTGFTPAQYRAQHQS